MINLDDIEIIDEFEDDEPAVDPRKRGPLIGKIQIVDQADDCPRVIPDHDPQKVVNKATDAGVVLCSWEQTGGCHKR